MATRAFARAYDIPFACSQVLKPFIPLSPNGQSDLAKWILDPKLPSFMALLAAVHRPDGSRLDAEEYLSVGPKLIDASESCKMTLEAMTEELKLRARFAVSTPDLEGVKDDETILMTFFPFEDLPSKPRESQIDKTKYQLCGLIYKKDGRFGASTLSNGNWTSIGSGYVENTTITTQDGVEIVVEIWGLKEFENKGMRQYSLDRDEMVECYYWDEQNHRISKHERPVKRPFLTLGIGEYAESMPYHYDKDTNPFPKFPTKHIGKKVLMVKLDRPGDHRGGYAQRAPAFLAWVPCKENTQKTIDVYEPRLLYIDDCFSRQISWAQFATAYDIYKNLTGRENVDCVLVSVSEHRIELITQRNTIVEEKPPSIVFMEPVRVVVGEGQPHTMLLGAVLFGLMNDDGRPRYIGCPKLIRFKKEEKDQVKEYLRKLAKEYLRELVKEYLTELAIEFPKRRFGECEEKWTIKCVRKVEEQDSFADIDDVWEGLQEGGTESKGIACEFLVAQMSV